jgi:class 3 adenylate cyclase
MALPTGTVTFVFTDIEGSTRLLQALGPERYGRLQDDHNAILRAAIERGGGVEIRTEGDSFFAVFGSPGGAVLAAAEAQRGLASHDWPYGSEIRVRIGMHTGEGALGGDDYLGIDVNRAARIATVGHGGQVVVSAATAGLVEHALPEGVALRDLGTHRLKDFTDPVRLHDLVIDRLPSDFPQLRSLDARPTNLPAERTSFVGRAEEVAQLETLLQEARLITLVGPGGTGKTRLAMRVATLALDGFPDGAFLVDLSAVTDSELVLPEIAAGLKVRREPGQDVAEALLANLGNRRLLAARRCGSRESIASRCSRCPCLTTTPPTSRRSTRCVCSPSEPPPSTRDSSWTREPPRRSRASWQRSTVCRWRSNWPRAG